MTVNFEGILPGSRQYYLLTSSVGPQPVSEANVSNLQKLPATGWLVSSSAHSLGSVPGGGTGWLKERGENLGCSRSRDPDYCDGTPSGRRK
jgi:hypothetical protein